MNVAKDLPRWKRVVDELQAEGWALERICLGALSMSIAMLQGTPIATQLEFRNAVKKLLTPGN